MPLRTCKLPMSGRDVCGGVLKPKMEHVCECKSRDMERHDDENLGFSRYLGSRGIATKREVHVPDSENDRPGARPGDNSFTTVKGAHFTHYLVDFAIVSECHNGDIFSIGTNRTRMSTKRTENKKMGLHNESVVNSDAVFVPMVLTTSGGIGAMANTPLLAIATMLAERDHTTVSFEMSLLRRYLSTLVIRNQGRYLSYLVHRI